MSAVLQLVAAFAQQNSRDNRSRLDRVNPDQTDEEEQTKPNSMSESEPKVSHDRIFPVTTTLRDKMAILWFCR